VIKIGASEGLHFSVLWGQEQACGSAAEATRGHLSAHIGDHLVWGRETEAGVEGIEWTWIELLEHLTSNWSALLWEEADPIGLDSSPHSLRSLAEVRWRELPESLRDAEEHDLIWFEHSHNLAQGLQGAWPQALWILRQGLLCTVSSEEDGCEVVSRLDVVTRTLSELGECLVARVSGLDDARAAAAVDAWSTKDSVSVEEFVETSTGLPIEDLRAIAGDRSLQDAWGITDNYQPNELLAAARMIGKALDPEVIRTVTERVKNLELGYTPSLDQLSGVAREEMRDGRPFDQGYALAAWLRGQRGLEDRPVDPRAVLEHWGVDCIEFELPSAALDAICSWGPRHGPAILINKAGRHSTGWALNATLAHEICHLLVDRGHGLPLGEVLGGRVPDRLEARARAFAAEFLLPRSVAEAVFIETGSVKGALRRLSAKYRVSGELGAWQIVNSGVYLPRPESEYIWSRVGDRWRTH